MDMLRRERDKEIARGNELSQEVEKVKRKLALNSPKKPAVVQEKVLAIEGLVPFRDLC